MTYTYNSNRKQIVDAVGFDAYIFDEHGNIASDASKSYFFDWNNRLRSVTKSSVTTTYDYDHKGIRVKKATPSETTIFIDKYTELRGANVIRHIFPTTKESLTFTGQLLGEKLFFETKTNQSKMIVSF